MLELRPEWIRIKCKKLNPAEMHKYFKLLFTTGIVLYIILQIVEYFFVIQYTAVPKIINNALNRRLTKVQVVDLGLEINIPRGTTRSSCGCPVLKTSTSSAGSPSSSCSLEAGSAGSGQKVISYSLFVKSVQDKEFFFDGIAENLHKIEEIFPDWIVYIFTNMPSNALPCYLLCRYQNLFWCDIRRIPELGDLRDVNGMVWRFLPISDPNVDILISRDLDSLASEREKLAVNEWIRSKKVFHVIRDSQWHETEILAGLWGAKIYLLSPQVKAHLQSTFITEGRADLRKIHDQEIVFKNVFLPYKFTTLAHDSYFCTKFGESETLPFSTRRKGEEFVGHDKFKEMSRLFVGRLKSCPVECRPIHGKHWTYC